MKTVNRGSIVMVELNGEGHIQRGVRPAIIISNSKACEVSPTLIVVPLTSRTKKPLPTHVKLEPNSTNGLNCISTFLGEQVVTINRTAIKKVIGILDSMEQKKINKAIINSLAL